MEQGGTERWPLDRDRNWGGRGVGIDPRSHPYNAGAEHAGFSPTRQGGEGLRVYYILYVVAVHFYRVKGRGLFSLYDEWCNKGDANHAEQRRWQQCRERPEDPNQEQKHRSYVTTMI